MTALTRVRASTLVLLARAILDRQKWAFKMFGNSTIGAALFFAYVDSGAWLSANELANLAAVSDDTARRVLNRLTRIGRVEERVIDRCRKYRLDPNLANRAADMTIKGIQEIVK